MFLQRKVLITGGPVHAHIDDVKIVTNRFRGGLMASLAKELATRFNCQVTYLTAPGAETPLEITDGSITVVKHSGFYDYQAKVLEVAPQHTDVILGAAVLNLIPKNPIKGKFPSHNYQEGETVSLDFVITPRVITQVKKVAPKVNLFGFKLLSGASHDELMEAAWHTLISSKALAVIANDATDLQTKYVLTKEAGEHPMPNTELASFLYELMCEEHYRTVDKMPEIPKWIRENPKFFESSQRTINSAFDAFKKLIGEYSQRPRFFIKKQGLIFGTVAYKTNNGGFWTTGRGKHELNESCYVIDVDHVDKVVYTKDGKASLNAPLLHNILYIDDSVKAVVHGHFQDPTLPTLPYATPGTVRDSIRDVSGSFNIANHGCFLLLDKDLNVMMKV
jgi:hypothetical protein